MAVSLRPFQATAVAPTVAGKRYSYGVALAPMPKTCSVDGCHLPVDSHGFCPKHAQRFRRYGDPLYVTPEATRRANNRNAQLARFSDGDVKETTYRKRLGRHEHRVVAEAMLGRPLEPGEIVHHIDGDRHNNDPSNLQVMLQADHIREHLAPSRRPIDWQGRSLFASDWARELGVPINVFINRHAAGWSMDRIATTPVRRWSRRNG